MKFELLINLGISKDAGGWGTQMLNDPKTNLQKFPVGRLTRKISPKLGVRFFSNFVSGLNLTVYR